MSRRPFTRALLASAALAAAIALAGCNADSIAPSGRANAPLSDKMLNELASKRMDKESPILVRLFKEEAEAEVWKKNQDGEFALLKTYPICRWSGDLGPKIKEGDRQAPEGFYTITPGLMNPNSNFYLAFNTGYPNAFDRAHGRTGSELMVHGDCSSRGCYAMTDEQMVEIYALARESFFGGQKSFQLQAYPFRMTARNMARHRNSPHLAFWKNLKTGYDHFEVSHQEPKVDVCDKRYVFDAAAPEGARPLAFNPRGKCPVYEIQKEIAELVKERSHQESAEYASLVASNISTVPSRKGIDGGMNSVFLAQMSAPTFDNEGRMQGNVPVVGHVPGALPREPNRPPAQVVPPAQPVQVAAAEPEPLPVVRVANVPVPRQAPLAKEGEAPQEQPTTIAGLLGNIFGGSQNEPQPTAAAEPAAAPVAVPAPAPRPARTAIARAKPEPRPTRVAVAQPAPAQPASPWPETKPASPWPAAAKPASVWPEPAKPEARTASAPTAQKPAPVQQAQKPATNAPALRPRLKDDDAAPAAKTAKPEKEPQIRTAYSAPAPGKLLSGAQPVVQSGSFETRWSATFR